MEPSLLQFSVGANDWRDLKATIEGQARGGIYYKEEDLDGPLLLACKMGHPRCVEILLKNGARVDPPDTVLVGGFDAKMKDPLAYCEAPLHASITHGNVECATMLIKNNADVDRMGKYNMTTPLQCACYFQHVDIAKLLLKHGADVNLEDDENATPLINAVCNGSPACVRLMLSARADVTVVHNGRTALQWARYFVRSGPQMSAAENASNDHKACVKLLEPEERKERGSKRKLSVAANYYY